MFRRECRGTRWDLENGICLCRRCHRIQRHKPHDFLVWVGERMGEEAFQALGDRSRRITKFTEEDRQTLLAELKDV